MAEVITSLAKSIARTAVISWRNDFNTLSNLLTEHSNVISLHFILPTMGTDRMFHPLYDKHHCTSA